MVTIDDIGNGTGYLYCTDLDAVLQSADKNNADGIRNMHNLGIGAAPLAANKSAIGAITINSCASAGSITSVTVDGNELLAGNYDITTNNVTTEAQGLAAAINANTPVTGYKYFAYNVLGVCYLQAPQSAGTLANGLVVDAAVSIGSINYSTTDMSGGTDSTGLTDDISGRRFFMDSDPLATATDLSDRCIEITKYIVVRGLQSGFISKTLDIVNDSLGTIDRQSAVETIYLNPESGNSDTLVFLTPDGYVDGDIIILKTFDDANTITVEDYGASSSPFRKNIFLSNQIPYALSNRLLAILLQYQYSPLYGGIFTELNRMASVNQGIIEILTADLKAEMVAQTLKPGVLYRITDPPTPVQEWMVLAININKIESFGMGRLDFDYGYVRVSYDWDNLYLTGIFDDKNNNHITDTYSASKGNIQAFDFSNIGNVNNRIHATTLTLGTDNVFKGCDFFNGTLVAGNNNTFEKVNLPSNASLTVGDSNNLNNIKIPIYGIIVFDNSRTLYDQVFLASANFTGADIPFGGNSAVDGQYTNNACYLTCDLENTDVYDPGTKTLDITNYLSTLGNSGTYADIIYLTCESDITIDIIKYNRTNSKQIIFKNVSGISTAITFTRSALGTYGSGSEAYIWGDENYPNELLLTKGVSGFDDEIHLTINAPAGGSRYCWIEKWKLISGTVRPYNYNAGSPLLALKSAMTTDSAGDTALDFNYPFDLESHIPTLVLFKYYAGDLTGSVVKIINDAGDLITNTTLTNCVIGTELAYQLSGQMVDSGNISLEVVTPSSDTTGQVDVFVYGIRRP